MEIAYRVLKLGAPARLVLAGALYAGAAALQIGTRNAALGLVPILLGWLVLSPKPSGNKPDDQGYEEWRAVSMAEITRVADSIAASRKLKARVAGPVVLGVLALLALGAAALFSLAALPPASLAFADLALFLVPGLFFGRVGVHVPRDIEKKLGSFLALIDHGAPAGYLLTPYLRFDKDPAGRDIPEDLRFMLEPKRKGAGLVGVQFQVAMNSGPNGEVPYLYAVVLTRGTGGAAYALFARQRVRGCVVEPGGDGEYGTVVLRQETEGGGYHTTRDDCARLFETVVAILQGLG
ncbi:MAG: hypothetical protein JXA15_00640 [Spirochaetales bacterium]|nr:hypothetical protein [Spirochaetales bacterium]